jgi:hypothetical protein
MNAINKQTDCLTRLIAEVVKLDSDKQCLAVELDYLIRHLQMYKETCEDAKHREEFPDHRMCECACCIDCGCCECEKEEEEPEEEEPEEESDEEEETPTCGFCGKDAGQSPIEHHKWDELYFCSQKCCDDYE